MYKDGSAKGVVIQENTNSSVDAGQIISKAIGFLNLLMSQTLVKRLVSMILIVAGLPNARITELTGLCDKSVRVLRKNLESGEIDSLFHIGGGGRKRKLVDFEEAIVEEVNNGSYHSQQQIVDMVYEKYGIKVTTNTISRLLKKTASSG